MLAIGHDHLAVLRQGQLYTCGDNLFAQLLRAPEEGLHKTGKNPLRVWCSAYSTYLAMPDGIYRSGPYRKIIDGQVLDFAADEEFFAYLTPSGEYRDSQNNTHPGKYKSLRLRGNYLALANDNTIELLTPVSLSIRKPSTSFDVTCNDVWYVSEGRCYNSEKEYSLPYKARAVVCGNSHVLVLLENGEVWARGNDEWGQLGTGRRVDGTRDHFALVSGVGEVQEIFAGEDMSAVLTSKGQLFVWGRNDVQQLGFRSQYEGVVQPTRLNF